MENRRIDWIDQYRGLAMLFVVLSHTCTAYRGFYTYSMLPMFFFISGFLHKQRFSARDLFNRLLFRLYIPLVVFGTLPHLLQIIKTHSLSPIMNYLVGITTGVGVGWFLPCLIVIEIFVFIIDKITYKLTIKGYVFVTSGICLISFIGMFIVKERSNLFWAVDTAIISIGFYYVGSLYNRYYKKYPLALNRWLSVIILVTIVSFSYFLLSKGYYFNISINQISSPWVVYPMCLLSCFAFIPISRNILNFKIFTWMGRNSLLIYCTNVYIRPIAIFIISCLSLNSLISQEYIIGLINCIIQLLIIYLLSIIVNRYFPYIVGNSRKY